MVVEPHVLKKYARQIGSFPQVGMKIKKCLSCHHPVVLAMIDVMRFFWSFVKVCSNHKSLSFKKVVIEVGFREVAGRILKVYYCKARLRQLVKWLPFYSGI